ncbi:MAG: hypothetical protein R2854_06155 [Caldilineaceae bacterium]
MQAQPGWNFSDWTSGWAIGVPPDGFSGCSGVIHWHLIYTLGLASALEEWMDDPLSAALAKSAHPAGRRRQEPLVGRRPRPLRR